jgi:DnaJ-class molecular chaperone
MLNSRSIWNKIGVIMTKNEAMWLLGFSVMPNKDEINSAYRKLALISHPDKGGKKEAFQALWNAKVFY